jgi:hypothetical protein
MFEPSLILLFALHVGPILLALGVLVSLGVKGLHTQYPAFFGYWAFDAVGGILLLVWASPRSKLYLYSWLSLTVVRWVLEYLVVMELVDRIFSDHPGIARVGGRVVQASLAVSFVLSACIMYYDWPAKKGLSVFYLSFEADRVVSGFILFFVLMLSVLLWRLPVWLSRNAELYCFGFTLYFLFKMIPFLVVNLRGPDVLDTWNYVLIGGVSLCQIMWITTLTSRGFERSPAFIRSWTSDEQQRLLSVLNGFSKQLSRGWRH